MLVISLFLIIIICFWFLWQIGDSDHPTDAIVVIILMIVIMIAGGIISVVL